MLQKESYSSASAGNWILIANQKGHFQLSEYLAEEEATEHSEKRHSYCYTGHEINHSVW